MRDTRPSRTAEAVCFMRASEQAPPAEARILDDPYASAFLGPVYSAALATGLLVAPFWRQLTTYVLARHRFIDDALLAALRREDPVDQVVVLGAGYDSRAWRFADALAGRPVFEVDHPATQGRKQALVDAMSTPPTDVRRVPIDFRVDRIDEVLPRAGFHAGRPTFFVWEGVSMYLRRDAVRATLTALHALGGPGSVLAMDAWYLLDDPGAAATAHRLGANLLSAIGEPLTFALHPEDAPAFLGSVGWTVRDLADAPELTRRYVRDGRAVYPATYVLAAERSSG